MPEKDNEQAEPVATDGTSAGSRATSAVCVVCSDPGPGRLLFHTSRPILRCSACGLVYAEPHSAATTSVYTEDYYRDGVYADYLADREAIRANAPRLCAELERMTEGRTLLDVGCATGFFLEAARDRSWLARGLEVSTYASAYARRELGLDVLTGSIVAPPAGLPRFDVVTMWDTIEHLDRPDVALANIHRLLNPQGVLVFSTGDYGSLLRRATRRRWRLFADPTHNFFFDERALRRLLARAGFRVDRVTRRGKRVSLSLILHQSRLPLSGRVRRWLLARGWNPALYVNLRDVVTVFARALPDEARATDREAARAINAFLA